MSARIQSKLDEVTRLVVIDERKLSTEGGGIVYDIRDEGIRLEAYFQDDDRTLKIFIKKR